MSKFNVGDRVKCLAVSNYSFCPCYGTVMQFVPPMLYRVKTDVEKCTCDKDGYWNFLEHELTAATDEYEKSSNSMKIVITSDGKTTLARLYDGNKVVQRAEAVCSTDDKFDFRFGAELAMERLMGYDEKKPTYFSGKVVCVEKNEHRAYTVGKVYEFKDGRVTIDNGNTIPCHPVATLEEFNDIGFAVGAKFIQLVE